MHGWVVRVCWFIGRGKEKGWDVNNSTKEMLLDRYV